MCIGSDTGFVDCTTIRDLNLIPVAPCPCPCVPEQVDEPAASRAAVRVAGQLHAQAEPHAAPREEPAAVARALALVRAPAVVVASREFRAPTEIAVDSLLVFHPGSFFRAVRVDSEVPELPESCVPAKPRVNRGL